MDDTHSTEPSFARDLGLFDATMIGVGAMIGAGIFVLTSIAAGEAGPASIMAFALNGARVPLIRKDNKIVSHVTRAHATKTG